MSQLVRCKNCVKPVEFDLDTLDGVYRGHCCGTSYGEVSCDDFVEID